MAGREGKTNDRDGRTENRRDDSQASGTQPATSSRSSSPLEKEDDHNGQRPTSSTVGISGSSAPQDSPARSTVIAPPATATQKALGYITTMWGFICFLWTLRVIRLICTLAYAYLCYKYSPLKEDALSTMTMFLVINWIIHSLYRNLGSIFFKAIAILWLLWLAYAILLHLIIVEVVRSIYLTSTKARLWLLAHQTLKVMFVDFAIFIGSILRVPFDYVRFIAQRLINGIISRIGR